MCLGHLECGVQFSFLIYASETTVIAVPTQRLTSLPTLLWAIFGELRNFIPNLMMEKDAP